jgi:hypothetical protein
MIHTTTHLPPFQRSVLRHYQHAPIVLRKTLDDTDVSVLLVHHHATQEIISQGQETTVNLVITTIALAKMLQRIGIMDTMKCFPEGEVRIEVRTFTTFVVLLILGG